MTSPLYQPIQVTVPTGKQGVKGDPGQPGQDAQWDSMTQAEYDALPDKDPNTLYVIID
jgi:hypothetical protein